jgi:hypothetical protein
MSRNYDNNSAKVFPKTKYTHLDKEGKYKCQGSCCSCKYVNTYSTENIPNIYVKFEHKPYKLGNKYIGV